MRLLPNFFGHLYWFAVPYTGHLPTCLPTLSALHDRGDQQFVSAITPRCRRRRRRRRRRRCCCCSAEVQTDAARPRSHHCCHCSTPQHAQAVRYSCWTVIGTRTPVCTLFDLSSTPASCTGTVRFSNWQQRYQWCNSIASFDGENPYVNTTTSITILPDKSK